jgi:hypothetical protein
MFVPMRQYGKYGFVSDSPASTLPIGAWSGARNVKFRGGYIERVYEPTRIDQEPAPGQQSIPTGAMWAQQFFDSQVVRFIVATRTGLYLSGVDGPTTWLDVTRSSGPYTTPAVVDGGYWQSFAWGSTVVFNNGVDIPQVFDPVGNRFVDLPKFGIITTDDGTPDHDTNLRCRALIPYKAFLVALNCYEDGVDRPNTVWWSDTYTTPNLWEDPGYNPWDYNSATNNGGQNQVGLEDGPLQWGATLGEGLMVYATTSCTQMLFVGGPNVMDFRRLFEYGCAGIYCATEFMNAHYVVSGDVMYVHDGNSVKQIAEDRVRDWFYRNVRNLERSCRTVTDYTQREVIIYFDTVNSDGVTNPPSPHRLALVYNYEDDNYTVLDAVVDGGGGLFAVNCMLPGLDLGLFTEVGQTWDLQVGTWNTQEEKRWGQLQGDSGSRAINVVIYWLSDTGLYKAYDNSVPNNNKSYMVRITNVDLDELDPKLTTNLWKHIRQVYPHIIGEGTMRARFGWSPNLAFEPTWGEWIDYILKGDGTNVKLDCRTTGRYLAIEYDFRLVNAMRFSGADFDVLPVYGR